MINALEKVVYPNGKTQSLAEIGGAVEGLSALIDEVDRNTSAIASINQQLGQLVGGWRKILEFSGLSATSQINKNIYLLLQKNNENIYDYFTGKELRFDLFVRNIEGDFYIEIFSNYYDGDVLIDYVNNHLSRGTCYINGGVINTATSPNSFCSYELKDTYMIAHGIASTDISTDYDLVVKIYAKDKPTPPTRTVKKKAVAKKKGETK